MSRKSQIILTDMNKDFTNHSYGYEQRFTDKYYRCAQKFTDKSSFFSDFIRIYPNFSVFLLFFIRIYPNLSDFYPNFFVFLLFFIRIYPNLSDFYPNFSEFLWFSLIFSEFLWFSRFFFVSLHPKSAARKKGGDVIIFMKVLKNDEALPSEIDSRAFFVVGTETRRLQCCKPPCLLE